VEKLSELFKGARTTKQLSPIGPARMQSTYSHKIEMLRSSETKLEPQLFTSIVMPRRVTFRVSEDSLPIRDIKANSQFIYQVAKPEEKPKKELVKEEKIRKTKNVKRRKIVVKTLSI
jgi:hypothetical protein